MDEVEIFFSSGNVNQMQFLLVNCKLFVAGIVHMFPLHFRAPNIVLGCKKCFQMPILCYMVYNPDSVRPLVKPRNIYEMPTMEKCLPHVLFIKEAQTHFKLCELC